MKTYINRIIYPELKNHLSKPHVTLITGLRRSGKTTLVRQLLSEFKSENKIYLDLESIGNRQIFSEKNYDNILLTLIERGLNPKEKMVIALDEIQFLPNIPSVIKYLYDNYSIKFIVTGSSSYYIKNLFSESLAGRKKVFELKTLSFKEFLEFRGVKYKTPENFKKRMINSDYERIKHYYNEYIKYGGFPEVTLAESISDKNDILNDIINSYLSIDLKQLTDIRDQKNIHLLMKMLANRVATRIDYSKISSLTGISRPTVHNYFDLLESTFIISRVPVKTKNYDREIVKAPKLYFRDNGLLNHLAELSSGMQFENALFNQLSFYGNVSYYSLKTGKEIDFILNDNIALEAKEIATEHDMKRLYSLSKNLNIKQNHLVVRHPSPTYDNVIWGGDL